MKLLITGGAGFIGSNFIQHCIKNHPDYIITNLDMLTYAGNPDNMKAFRFSKNYSFVQGDICDREFVSRQLEGIDIVVHFAAESHVDRSFNSSLKFTMANTYGTHVLLECVKNSSVFKFIHISTDEVYGEVLHGSSRESDPLAPTNPYSASKAAAEMILFGYMKAYGLPIVIARPNNNYGPFQFPEKLIPRFITNTIVGNRLPLQNPHPRRTYIHVEDTARAIEVLIHKGLPGECYNIGTHDEFSNHEIAMMILDSFGQSEDAITHVQDRPFNDMRYSVDSSKINALGWEQKIPFSAGFTDTIEWYLKNQWWWNKNPCVSQNGHAALPFTPKAHKNRLLATRP